MLAHKAVQNLALHGINLITGLPKVGSYAILQTMSQLTNRRHEIFAIELAAGAPLLSAYLTAGYRETYSARFNASRLRNTAKIKERINELLQEFGERTRIKLEWVQETIAPLLEIDPGELYEPSPDPADPTRMTLKPLSSLPARVRKAITRIKVDPETGKPVEVFLTDKVSVANALMRTLQGSEDDRAEGGQVQFNFHWSRVGDITNDLPQQLARQAEAQREAVALDRVLTDPRARKLFEDGDAKKV